MAQYVVIGATGDVGRGIVGVLLDAGHTVIAVARDAARLEALTDELAQPDALTACTGNFTDDASADAVVAHIRDTTGAIDGVVISINGPRQLPGLLALPSEQFAALVNFDLLTHFTAARAFIPALAPGGMLVGIGGGSADFILAGGAHMSVAQAGLRMVYRGLAQELGENAVHVRLLTIASVVNGHSTRAFAKPEWVTDREVGDRVAMLLRDPGDMPVWRIGRRDESGQPTFGADPPTRVQGLTT